MSTPRYRVQIIAGTGQTVTVASALPVTPMVLVTTTEDGLAAPDAPLIWTASGDSSVNNLGVLRTTTASSGIATGLSAATWQMGASALTYNLTVQVPGQNSNLVAFQAVATVAAPAFLTPVSTVSQSTTTSTIVSDPPSVLVTDAGNNPVAGYPVSWAVTAGGGSIDTTGATVTNGSGLATLPRWTTGAGAGLNTVTATAAGLSGSPATFSVTGTASVPFSIAINSGDGQTGVTAGSAGSAFTVIVKDVTTAAVANATVTWAVLSGGGSIAASSLTNGSGIASATLTSGATSPRDTAGVNTVTATVAGVGSVTFTLNAVAGTKTKLAIQTQPASNAASGVALPGQPVILIQDANDNTVTSATDTITATVGTGPGSVTAGGTKAAVAGVATFTALTITDVTGSSNLLHFASGSLTAVDAASATVVAPPVPTALLFVTQPNSVSVGVSSLGCSVRVVDSGGTTIPGGTNAVTLALTTPAGATLTPTAPATLTVNCVNGVATFAGLSVDLVNTYTLTATSGSLTPAVSSSFSVTAVSGVVYDLQPSGHTTIHEFFHDKTQAQLGSSSMHTVSGVTGQIYVLGNYHNLHTEFSLDDTTAPFGVTQVGRTRYSSGTTYNGTAADNLGMWSAPQLTVFYPNQLYVCHIFKIVGDGTAYENNAGGCKWGFWHSGHTTQSAINLLWLNNNGSGTQTRETQWKLQFKQQGGSPSPGVMGQINRNQNNGFSGTYRLQLNTWHKVQLIANMSTLGAEVQTGSGTSATWRADGTLDVYVSDWTGSGWTTPDHIMTYSDVCYRRNAAGFNAAFGFAYWNPTYGGGSTIPLSQNNDIYHARWFVSGK